MNVLHELPQTKDSAPVVLAIGNFDGVHRGHQRVLSTLVSTAERENAKHVVVTFEPHPRCVIDPEHCPQRLTTAEEKLEELEKHGVETVVVLPFTTELSHVSAEAFCGQLTDAFTVSGIVVGENFALGLERRGDVAFLRAYGFEVTVAEAERVDEKVVASSLIRDDLTEGRLESANHLLGYLYEVRGAVARGEQVGRTIGFPTANVAVAPEKCLPACGIYATWVHVRNAWHMGAASIGYRPTFGGKTLAVEVFLLDFSEDIYDEDIRVAFVARLREERYYPEVDALVAQIKQDVIDTRQLLKQASPPSE